MTRKHTPAKLPVEIQLLTLPCVKCRAAATRAGVIGIYSLPLCDGCTVPETPSRKMLHAAMVFDCNRAAGDMANARHLLCEIQRMMEGADG